jgi:D-alanyl-D-alanine endopeptidase (penicillin-binding protein 7)
MDNTTSFYLVNVGSIPARRAIMLVLALALSSTVIAKPKPVAPPASEARAVLLFDQKTNTIKEAVNIHKRLPIASISKLMTAYVVLESNANLNEKITIVPQTVQGSRSLRPGMVVTRRELLNMALIASDNLAAKMLADLHPSGYVEFMREMNRTAKRLGMINTGFGDPSGLSVFNTSTAWDLHLLNTALTKYSIFNDAAMQKTSTQYAYGKHGQLQQIVIRNTNALAGEYDIKVGKTGFTNPAGWCISLLIKHKGQEFDLIVLGVPTKKLRNDLVISKLKDYIVISDSAIDQLEWSARY